MVRGRNEGPQEDHWQCTSSHMSSGSALLGDFLGVSRSVECDLSVLFCPRFFSSVCILLIVFIRDVSFCCIL